MYPSCSFWGFLCLHFYYVFWVGCWSSAEILSSVGATPFLQLNPEENVSLSNMCTYERATQKNAQRCPLIWRLTHSLSQSCCQNGANLLKNYVSLNTKSVLTLASFRSAQSNSGRKCDSFGPVRTQQSQCAQKTAVPPWTGGFDRANSELWRGPMW